MLAIGLRYLCGWAMATDPADRMTAEWPPHPDRVFMALAAAHFDGERQTEEREALERLERFGAPAIHASPATQRTAVTAYVPVNDVTAPKAARGSSGSKASSSRGGLAVLPESRPRQARQFPTTIPADPTVFLVWPDAIVSQETAEALSLLCRKVVRVGHSASLVQMWLDAEPPPPTWVPAARDGLLRLRVPGIGRLPALEESFTAGLRPQPSLWEAYGRPRDAPMSFPHTRFSDALIVLRQAGGHRVGLEATLLVADTVRKAVMSHAAAPLPEWLMGHQADGRPSEQPHVAFAPLPHVGREHADGHLLGVALVVPRHVSTQEVGRVLGPTLRTAAGAGLRIFNGGALDVTLVSGLEEGTALALQPETWTRASRRWATVTPIALDRFPKRANDIEQAIALACERIGAPRPIDVSAAAISVIRGVPPAGAFAPLRLRGAARGSRYHVHAVVEFEAPIVGPLLLGAGRYRGYGLCRPLREEA